MRDRVTPIMHKALHFAIPEAHSQGPPSLGFNPLIGSSRGFE